jgi:predicted MFS family arabinose efflux permease
MEAAGTATRGVASPLQARRWAVALALSANGWATTLTLITLGVLLPGINGTFQLSATQAGWLGGVTTAGYLIVTVPAAMFLARLSPRLLTAVSVGGGALFTFLHGVAPAFLALFLARLGFSLCFALRPASQALVIQQWFPVREVPIVQGIIMAMLGAAEFVALWATPVLVGVTGGWRQVYFLYGLIGVAITGLWVFIARPVAGSHGGPAPAPSGSATTGSSYLSSFRAVLRYREVWLVGIATLTSGLGWWAFGTFWPSFMLKRYGLSLAQSGFLYGVTSLAMVPSSLAFGWLGPRLRRRRFVLVGVAIAVGVSSVGSLLTGNFWVLLVLSLVSGAAWGYVPIAFSIPYEIEGIRPPEVAMSMSVIHVFMMSGGLIGPAMVGMLADLTGSLFFGLMVSAIIPFAMVFAVLGLRDHGPAHVTRAAS